MKNQKSAYAYVELAVIIVIIAILAAFAVPRFIESKERSKASEAYHFLTLVRASQEKHLSANGLYASDISDLDLEVNPPELFKMGRVSPGSTGSLKGSWIITMTRENAALGYGDYTITFTQDGFSTEQSSISEFPAINPFTSL